jgi:hypothetical protein
VNRALADYDKYTIEELHAEVCFTEILNMQACLGFIEDESLMGMVKSALKIRSCNSIYTYVCGHQQPGPEFTTFDHFS